MQQQRHGEVVDRIHERDSHEPARWLRQLPDDDSHLESPKCAEDDGRALPSRRARRVDVTDGDEYQHDERQQDERVGRGRQTHGDHIQRDDVPVGRKASEEVIAATKQKVHALTARFPVYGA